MCDQISITQPEDVTVDHSCPQTDCNATLTVSYDCHPPDYRVDCPECGFNDIWVSG